MRPILSLCCALQWLMIGPLFADTSCPQALLKAERDLEEGHIEDVPALKGPCLQGRATQQEEAQAHALLAKAHLALDQHPEAARSIEALVRLVPDFSPEYSDSRSFAELLDATKASIYSVRVGTVSKTDEPLREAPASVIVIDGYELLQRGYLDLEELLHDLPGIDVSRGNGDVYSNIYMRGYRSDRSDRLLFLIDGVEQNDLHSATAHISRQIPLSNIQRVEVVYGPASTIYGANAFTGVVSITTKSPVVGEEKQWEVDGLLTAGSFGTSMIDARVATNSLEGQVSFSLTSRFFQSEEQDLGSLSDWDYDFERGLEAVDLGSLLRKEGTVARDLAFGDGALAFFCPFTGWCRVVENHGEVTAIEATESGKAEALRRDLELFDRLQGRGLSFADDTEDGAIDLRLRISNFELGLQHSRRREGTTPWYTDLSRAGSEAGNQWVPKQTAIFARYAKPIGRSVWMSFFSRWKVHELGRGSSLGLFRTYSGGVLDVVELVLGTTSSFQRVAFQQKSTQLRNELTLVWEPSRDLSWIAGLEHRASSVQADFVSGVSEQIPELSFSFFNTQLSDTKTELTDLGVFAQLAYRPFSSLKLVLGGRFDERRVSSNSVFLTYDRFPNGELSPGVCDLLFGSFPCDELSGSFEAPESTRVFSPRLAAVYSRGPLVVKGIYSEAFREPSNLQRFTREPGIRELANPTLNPEEARNLELALGHYGSRDRYLQLSIYQTEYSDTVALRNRLSPGGLRDGLRFENTGRARIRGLEIRSEYGHEQWRLFGNYTYTDPVALDPTDLQGRPLPGVEQARVADIAEHRLNLGLRAELGERWELNLRSNWVGERQTGTGTTAPANPLGRIGSYWVVNGALSFRGLLPGATWQLIGRNLFDRQYDHPGVQLGSTPFASSLPQPGRALYLRLIFRR